MANAFAAAAGWATSPSRSALRSCRRAWALPPVAGGRRHAACQPDGHRAVRKARGNTATTKPGCMWCAWAA